MRYHTPAYIYYNYSYLEMSHSYVQMSDSYIHIMLHLYILVTFSQYSNVHQEINFCKGVVQWNAKMSSSYKGLLYFYKDVFHFYIEV